MKLHIRPAQEPIFHISLGDLNICDNTIKKESSQKMSSKLVRILYSRSEVKGVHSHKRGLKINFLEINIYGYQKNRLEA